MARKDSALDKEALKHPNAFMADDGRTLYKYEFDGQVIIFPKPAEEMSQQDAFDFPLTILDSQPGRLPQNLTVVFRDPQWAGYWFNKKAGGARRIGYARSLGYVPAKIEDLESYFAGVNDQDGAVEEGGGDLVLFKIHKARMFAQLAEWIQKAKRDGGIDGYKNAATNSLAGNVPPEKMRYYHTPQALNEPQGLGRAPNE